jgi:hypothetical protein
MSEPFQCIEQVREAASATAESLVKLTNAYKERIGEIHDDVKALSYFATKNETTFIKCIRCLKEVADKILEIIDVLYEVYYYWSQDTQNIREDLTEVKDTGPLRNWIENLQRKLKAFEKKHEEYEELLKNLQIEDVLLKAIEECKNKETDIDDKRLKTQVVGKASATGLLGLGITGIVGTAVGISTFGIAPIIAVVTFAGAASAVLLAGGAAVVTSRYADSYTDAANKLRALNQKFNEVDKILQNHLKDDVSSLTREVNKLARVLDDVDIEANKSYNTENRHLLQAFELLEYFGIELEAKLSVVTATAKAANEKLQASCAIVDGATMLITEETLS